MVQRANKLVKKLLIKIHKRNQNSWLILSLLTTTSGIWFSFVLTFLGEKFKLIVIANTGNKSLTFIGWFLTILTIGWSCLSICAQRYYDYHTKNLQITDDDLASTETIYEKVNASLSHLCDKNLSEQINCITNILHGEIIAPKITEKPCEQLKEITTEIARNLSEFLTQKNYNIRVNDLYVTIYFCFDKDNPENWFRADNHRSKSGLSINELKANGTTFYEVLHNTDNFIFYNNKEDARKANKYKPDGLDEYTKNNELKGSIACYEIEIKNSEFNIIRAVISVGTYSKRFFPGNDAESLDNIKHNIRHIIFNVYEKYISTSLCKYYISLLHTKADHT